jgi:hypothetical protein
MFTTSLPLAGGRFYQEGASYGWGDGSYWLGTISSFTGDDFPGVTISSEPASYYMMFSTLLGRIAPVWEDFYREWGFTVRCIKQAD